MEILNYRELFAEYNKKLNSASSWEGRVEARIDFMRNFPVKGELVEHQDRRWVVIEVVPTPECVFYSLRQAKKDGGISEKGKRLEMIPHTEITSIEETWIPKGAGIHVVKAMFYPKISSLVLQMATGRCWTATGIYEQTQIDEILDTMGLQDVPVERID